MSFVYSTSTMLCNDSFMIDLSLFCFALSSCCFVSAATVFIFYLLAFYNLEYYYYCYRFIAALMCASFFFMFSTVPIHYIDIDSLYYGM